MRSSSTMITGLAIIASATSSPSFAHEDPGSGPATAYTCANGISIEVSYFEIRGHSAVEVSFPTGRDLGVRAKSLLPATQTGSGERYASDITEFHVKGDEASFATSASAKSEEIARVDCNRLIPNEERVPATQAAQAGQYFIRHPEGPGYFNAETICFVEDGQNYLALNDNAEAGQAVIYKSDWTIDYAWVGEVDAGAGQRRYNLTSVEDDQDVIALHFIAPGMREADLPSATAGISSISQRGARQECVDNDRIVYLGTSSEQGVAISLEDDGLVFRSFGQSDDVSWPEIRRGYVTQGDNGMVFEFLDSNNRVRIKTNRGGYLMPEAWQLTTPIAQRTALPTAYFIADAVVFDESLPTLDDATLDLLASLSLCNHLAGEVSENAARNEALQLSWDEASCDLVPTVYASALEQAGEGTALRDYLVNHSPSWL